MCNINNLVALASMEINFLKIKVFSKLLGKKKEKIDVDIFI